VRYRQEVHPGEQPALVDLEVWQDVQARLAQNGQAQSVARRSRTRALLQGLLHCRPCGCAMTPARVTRGHCCYRYYICSAAQRKGWHTCPSKSLPAAAIERYVLEQIGSRMPGGLGELSTLATAVSPEGAQRLRDLVARIDYDGASHQVAIALRSAFSTEKERL
jgi:hypothetical protein